MDTKILRRQIVIPFYKVPKKLLSRIETKKQLKDRGWKKFSYHGRVAGFWSPYYGSNRHVAVVEADVYKNGKIKRIENFLYDQIERADGPLRSPYAHATPNAMVVVIEEDKETLLVHSVSEWRPFIYNHKKKKKGINVIGVTGKWAKRLGQNPAKTALTGLISDMGIEIDTASFYEIGIHTPNRAWSETCNVVYVARFRRKTQRVSDKTHDIVKSGGLFPLSDFPVGPDALVNSALWMVARHFGCVVSKPGRKTSEAGRVASEAFLKSTS